VSEVRQPAVAGQFYPGNATALAAAVREYVEEVPLRSVADAGQGQGDGGHSDEPAPKAIIAPHAGFAYSGPVAGTAYARVAGSGEQIGRVVLVGPAHRVPVRGLALPDAGAFATPLGRVPVDAAAARSLLALDYVQVSGEAHAFEHCLEVQLPFLQEVLDSFAIVPLVVGHATPEQVSEALEKVWGGRETLIVISSDLSHYSDYEAAQVLDNAASRAIEELRYADLAEGQACGRTPIQGLLLQARQRQMQARTVDLRSSGDTAGPADRVVGYGAYVFT